MKDTAKLMFALIRKRFGGNAVIPDSIGEEEARKLLSLSDKLDISHIVADSLGDMIPQGEIKKEFQRKKLFAIFRREQLDAEERKIESVLEGEGIDHLPLKGAVIKNLYPESWLRTSCDIDILVREEQLSKAIGAVTERLGYSDGGRSHHDHSLISPNGVNLELHFSIKGTDKRLDGVLGRVWEYARPVERSHRYEMTDDYLMLHTVAHMQYHFITGGCGVKPFIDLWFLKKKLTLGDELYSLLQECGSREFYCRVQELAKVWLENASHSRLTEIMESYILSGGVFGSRENFGAAEIYAKGGKVKYILSRVFAPKEKLIILYPRLEKYPLLLPFYQVRRWFRLLDKDNRSGVRSEISGDQNAEKTAKMLKELGL